MRKSTLIVGGAIAAALIVGTGGGAYAAAKITGDDIVDGTVTGTDIKNGSLSTWRPHRPRHQRRSRVREG